MFHSFWRSIRHGRKDGNVPPRPASRRLSVNRTWFIVLPVGLWAVAAVYVPIFGSYLSAPKTWLLTLLIALLVALSLICHELGHRIAARWLGSGIPSTIPLYLFGDAAQAWPTAPSAWREMAVAVAGPAVSIVLAGLALLVWNAQIANIISLAMLFTFGFNVWLVMLNMTPAFPLDGGRFVRAIQRGLLRQSAPDSRLGIRFGVLIGVALIGWGILLIAQRTRFSWPTGLTTIGIAVLVLAGLGLSPAWQPEPDQVAVDNPQPTQRIIKQAIRIVLASILILALLACGATLLPLNDGLEAPGPALSVEPMVQVPAQYRHDHAGTFILTSVFIQAPITAGEWVIGQLTSVVKIVPATTVVPDNTTPQDLARRDYQMLDQSTVAASVVGLQLAGYQARMVGKGVEVMGFLPGSLANGPLQEGDVITAFDRKPVHTTDDLISQVKAQQPGATINVTIRRGQESMNVTAVLMPATAANPGPRLGISIQPAGFDTQLPFSVKIVPQKIDGGPSAGLMFTLTVDNLLSAQDLTGGRKIAGTGTIDLDGNVGPIGGVEQKVAAAELAGAEYFLAPVDNYEAARAVAQRIKVVKVATAEQAVDFLRSLTSP